MKAVGKTIIVQPTAEERKNCIIVIGAKEQAERNELNRGTVIAVGDDVKENIKIGDIIWYIEGTFWKNGIRTNLDEFTVDGQKYIGVKEHEIKLIETV